MRILVVGIGALGTVFSCLLKKAGHEVIGVDREPVASSIIKNGVRIDGIWGEHEAYLDRVYDNFDDLQTEKLDLVMVMVKSFATTDITKKLQGLMSNKTFMILAQNGYGNFEAASQNVEAKQIILARVIFGAETVSHGFSRVTVIADDVILGSPANLINFAFLEELAQIFSFAGIPTQASMEIMKYLWGKIIYNSALNPLGAILEVNYGKLAEITYTRELMNGMIEEVFAVLHAMGQETIWADADTYKKAFYGQMLPVTALHHSSMLQDIQRGRKIEIDALNGAVINLGAQYGVDTPVNKLITSLVKAKETLAV